MSTMKNEKMLPLCVDLDGTLLRGDVTWLAYQCARKKSPLGGGTLLKWTYEEGWASAKVKIAQYVDSKDLNISALPFSSLFHRYLQENRSQGRSLFLATGAPERLARYVSDYFGYFEDVIATKEGFNCIGNRKASALVERFGKESFLYAGNSRQDLPVWAAASQETILGVSCPGWLKLYLKLRYGKSLLLFD